MTNVDELSDGDYVSMAITLFGNLDNFVYQKVKSIIEDDSITSDVKYDMIFNDRVSGLIQLDYYDPDSSYEDDITAYYNALERKIANSNLQDTK